MILSVIIGIFMSIVVALLVLTLLQLHSKYRSHHMAEIIYDVRPPLHWPTKSWSKSTPEEQGVNSEKLQDLIAYYEKKQERNEDILIDSITIVRNEHIIGDFYFNPLFPKEKKHIINSCTKSIVGILIGIAIDKGYIKDVQVPVLTFFKSASIKTDIDDRLNLMTIKDLLTMRTGWHSQDSYLYQWTGLFAMQATDDWTEYILNLPFEASPGSRFDYSNMASFLLSAILSVASGMDTLLFAKKYLFDRLGITDVLWDKSPRGIYIGFARMWLKPHDMAKIGLLYIQKGQWENRQVVSPSWIENSIHASSFPKRYRYIYNDKRKKDFVTSGANWTISNLARPFSDGYGYHCWLDQSGMIAAIGVGGQYIMIVPNENLVVVVCSKLKGKNTFLPVTLLKKFILPSIVSKDPIPRNDSVNKRLVSYSSPPPLPIEEVADFELPSMAYRISGNNYVMEDSIRVNPWQYKTLSLEFDASKDYALFRYSTMDHQEIQYEVGLENQYLITDYKGKSYAAKGFWSNENVFVIDFEIIGYSSKGRWVLTFMKQSIEVEEVGMTGSYHYKGKNEKATVASGHFKP